MSHSEKTSHKEVITEIAKNLKVLSTRLTEIEHLENSKHSEYQEQWRNFYNRYNKAIVKYILIRARWGDNRTYDAQDIAQLVYQKALLGKNFKSKENEVFREIVKKVGFRVMIRRLVKDVLSDYFRKIGSDRHPVLLEDIEKADELTPLTQAKENATRTMQSCQAVLAEIEKRIQVYPSIQSVAHLHSNGKTIIIQKTPFTLGRKEGNSLVIDSTNTSKEHAQITFHNETFYLEDLKSTNGTYILTGEKAKKVSPKKKHPLVTNTTFRIGKNDNDPQIIFSIVGEEMTERV